MTTPQIPTADPAPPPWPSPDSTDHTINRVSELLLRFHRAAPRRAVLRPLADVTPAHDGSGDACIYATVFIDAGDGAGAQPYALNEVRLAAACLAQDPPFPAADAQGRGLAPRLFEAATHAANAALSLERSLS